MAVRSVEYLRALVKARLPRLGAVAALWGIALAGLLAYKTIGRIPLACLLAGLAACLILANVALAWRRAVQGTGPSGIYGVAALLGFLAGALLLWPCLDLTGRQNAATAAIWLFAFLCGFGYGIVACIAVALVALSFACGTASLRSLTPFLLLAAALVLDFGPVVLAGALFRRLLRGGSARAA